MRSRGMISDHMVVQELLQQKGAARYIAGDDIVKANEQYNKQ